MSTSSRFAVAVHTLALLTLEKRPLPSTYIAGSVNTNPVVIRRILGALNEAGLVNTLLGSEGGAELARPAEEITLLQVYRATEKGDLFSLHPNTPNPLCQCGSNIQPVLSAVFYRAERAMEGVLARTTIADVVQAIEARLERVYASYSR
ncbi:MAG: Rrf2 family transcriptional regulator [Chloroflexi bacterium]|nr:Rrf2 family transcriptional regulator [Chloroflexota bacterium]MCI0577375.1 Rrf2 family transcriptional regulator [Chloroflexota bacterium]MCI0647062.1 Rrf2 family transcriptional regulator [Chloroflexota bacterium]MCI0731549.1 Rrf2 family transcriptional regulator [Chloroflexota bacterium]